MSRLRGVAGQAGLAALVAAAIAAICAAGIEGLSDTDPYRHLAYARQIWESGFTLRGHPFLPQTLLGSSGVDLWWGFHLLLVPFSFLGVLWGGRLAGIGVAATQAGSMAALGRRLGQPRAWLVALLPTLTSAYWIARGFSARPGHLTIPLVALNLAAGAGELGPAWAAAASFVHGWLHLSSPLSPLFAGVGAAGAWLAGARPGWRAAASSVGGLSLAFALRPDRAHYLQTALAHNLGALGHSPAGHLPGSGLELLPLDGAAFAGETWMELAVLLGAVILGRGRPRCGSAAMRSASILASCLGALLCFEAGRFLDYLLPFLALAAGLWAPVELPKGRGMGFGLAALVLGFGVGTAAHIQRAWTLSNALISSPASFASLAAGVRSRVPPGTLLVTEDLLMAGVLYSYLPEYQYLCAYDPVLLEAQSPDQFWRWSHLVGEGRNCPQPECGFGVPDADESADAIRALGSDWFVSFGVRPEYSVLPLFHNHPELFALEGAVPVKGSFMSLWRVKRKAVRQ